MTDHHAATPVPSVFHPLIRRWFEERYGAPTEIQARAWPVVADGRHALITAPTGSGKTLTAFLWALDRLLTGTWPTGAPRVLYISPLKALNADIERNLSVPLAELTTLFRQAGEVVPTIRALTRSGDTPDAERRRMLRRPPEILITTPESLNILLTSKGGRGLLGGLATVIVDEIHAVAGSKRGTHLITAVDRLVRLSGEVQRVGLSATVRPLERVAEFLGGYEWDRVGGQAVYRRRSVEILRARTRKEYRLKVESPADVATAGSVAPEAAGEAREGGFWPAFAGRLRRVIRRNRSTLLFANSRRLTEKITRLLNETQEGASPAEVAYSHHGSLSKEIRSVVEQRLRAGELPAIVATSSLELGIDVGALDEVVLIQTPPEVSAAVQRLGRAGHGVGQISRGRLFPLFDRDYLDAAVVAEAVLEGDVEEIRPVHCPLDVLAQVVLSMACAERLQVDDLYDQLRSSSPFHTLSRRQLELVLEMLAGRYADSRLRDLKPRLSYDRVDGTLEAHRGAARLIYTSGGTIPDRGYFHLRLLESKAKLGELDEEFVWERSVGDTFTLGAQQWRIEDVTHNDVLVSPARGAASLAPFWRAEARDRGPHLSERIAVFLEEAEGRLGGSEDGADFAADLRRRCALSKQASVALLDLLHRQRQATGAPLPHRRHILVERYTDPYQAVDLGRGPESGRHQILLHTLWGGQVNRPFALALAVAWEEAYGHAPEILQDDDCINLVLPEDFDGQAEDLFELVHRSSLEDLLRRKLETTGFFGARFRENAARALLLPRGNPRNRLPLWLNRRRSKKLLETVSRYGDFPIVLETWRTCLEDELDLATLRRRLEEIRQGEVRITETATRTASPFAAGMIWTQTNKFMYEDDTPEGGRPSALQPDLLKELVLDGRLRPLLDPALVRRFEAKVQRTAPGYAPRSSVELRDWLEERILIPGEEWRALLRAVEDADVFSKEVRERAVAVVLPGTPGADPAIVAVTVLPRLLAALGVPGESVMLRAVGREGGRPEPPPQPVTAALKRRSAADRESPEGVEGREGAEDKDEAHDMLAGLVGEWVRFYGPFFPRRLTTVFGLDDERRERVTSILVENRVAVADALVRGVEEAQVCDSENLEILLRLRRAEARPAFEARALAELPLFLAAHQGLTEPADDLQGLQDRLEKLLGYGAPAAHWEGDLLPARMVPYYPSWLDSLMQENELLWLGCGRRRLTFTFAADVELLTQPAEADGEGPADSLLDAACFSGTGRHAVEDLARDAGVDPGRVTEELWRAAWQGRATSDTFLPVRRAVEARFRPLPQHPRQSLRSRQSSRSGRRGGRSRWVPAARPFPGLWSSLPAPTPPSDPLEAEELNRDRARLLLDRYGVLFRELLERELPALRWSRLFRSLRLMELSGEILAGVFFQGISGLQFASHAAFRRLRRGLPEEAVYWFSALDPASPCGLDLKSLKGELPPRRATTYLVYQGSERVVTALRRGKDLSIAAPPDHPQLPEYLTFFKVLLGREQHPLRAVEVETINGEPAVESPYLGVLRHLFSTTREAGSIKLRKSYTKGDAAWHRTG